MKKEYLVGDSSNLYQENSSTISSLLLRKLTHITNNATIVNIIPVYNFPNTMNEIYLKDIHILTEDRHFGERTLHWQTEIFSPVDTLTHDSQIPETLTDTIESLIARGYEVRNSIYIPPMQSLPRSMPEGEKWNDYLLCYFKKQSSGFRKGELFIPTGLCLGLGIGFATGNIPEWIFFGLGSGFAGLILSSYLK